MQWTIYGVAMLFKVLASSLTVYFVSCSGRIYQPRGARPKSAPPSALYEIVVDLPTIEIFSLTSSCHGHCGTSRLAGLVLWPTIHVFIAQATRYRINRGLYFHL